VRGRRTLKYGGRRDLKYGGTGTLKYAATMVVLTLAACGRPGGDAAVQQFESRVALRPGGAVDVEETLTITPGAGAGLVVHRGVADRHDGVSNVTATIDGRPAAMGDGPDQVRIEPGLALDVIWSAPSASTSVRSLGLHYQASGTVHVAGLRGTFTWRALPARRAFSIGTARVVLSLPAGTTTISDIHMAEPGWTVTRTGDGAVAEKTTVGADEPATIVAQFAVEAGSIARPVWQENMERGQLLVPAFISGALFILVVGLGVLVMVRLQSPGWSPAERETARAGLLKGGLVISVFGVLTALVFPSLLGHYGRAPMAIPISIVLVGVLLAATSGIVLRKT
jgi:hypothetical protein